MVSAYAGRTVDVSLWQPNGAGFFTDTKGRGYMVTGVYKLAQRFVVTLLNEESSPVYTFGRPVVGGTCLLSELRSGRICNEADMRAVFALAEMQARMQMSAEESTTDPTDERYKKSTLSSLTVSPGAIYLHITTESVAGTAASVILPIPIV